MRRPSISVPGWMWDQVEDRRVKGEPRSQYVREAIQARFNAEDADEWEAPAIEPPADYEEAEANAD